MIPGKVSQQNPSITFKSPKEIKESGGQNNGVSLFLYQIQENPYLKNEEPEGTSGGDGTVTLPLLPPLTLDLMYLVTPYHDDKTQEKFILGKVMQIFHDNGLLSGTTLQGVLSGTDEQLRLLLHPISLDELTKIWTAFPDVGYRLSVSYTVTPVRIDTLRSRLRPEGCVERYAPRLYGTPKRGRIGWLFKCHM